MLLYLYSTPGSPRSFTRAGLLVHWAASVTQQRVARARASVACLQQTFGRQIAECVVTVPLVLRVIGQACAVQSAWSARACAWALQLSVLD